MKFEENHDAAHRQLMSYLYGEMSPVESTAFEAAMETDAELAAQVSAFSEVRRVLASDRQSVPALTYGLLPPRSKDGWPWWRLVAAALLGVGMTTMVFLSTRPGPVAIPVVHADTDWHQDEGLIAELAKLRREISELKNALAQSTERSSSEKEWARIRYTLAKSTSAAESRVIQLMQDQEEGTRRWFDEWTAYLAKQRTADLELIQEGFDKLAQAMWYRESYESDLVNSIQN